MRYLKLSARYMFKNFWMILALSIVPGVLLGVLTDPTSIFSYIYNISTEGQSSFADIFLASSEMNWISVLIGVIVFPIVAVFISGLCGIESRHMRLGIKSIKNFRKRVNNNIVYVILIGIMLLIALELMAIIFTAFAFLWSRVFSRYWLLIMMNTIVASVLMIALIFVFSWCIIWLPTMTITGLNPKKALAQTLVNVRGKKLWGLFLAVALPLIPVYGISCVLAAFHIKYKFLFEIVSYTFMIMYYVTLMYTSYCEICDIDREDQKDQFAGYVGDGKEGNHHDN